MARPDSSELEQERAPAWHVSCDPDALPLDEAMLRARTDPTRGTPPLALERALASTRERHRADLRSARARAGISRGHLIEVVLELPGGRGDAGEQAAAETLLELLVGEARFEDWLGACTVVAAPRGGLLNVVQARPNAEHFFPLGELAAAIDAAVRGIHAGLPAVPLWSLGGEQRWYLLEIEAAAGEVDAAGSDVALVSTFMPELVKSYLSGAPFASARFSRAGELFAYLRYEHRDSDVRRALARRRVLEDALDAALVSERAGRVIGGGVGLLHAQVHLALERVAHGVAVVREVAGRIGVHARTSSIVFCDQALSG